MNDICKLIGSKLVKYEGTFPDSFFLYTNHSFADNDKNINMI